METTPGLIYKFLIFLLSVLFLYSIWNVYTAKRTCQQFQLRFFQLAANADLYLFEYDLRKDELQLSEPCARLLQLPATIPHYIDIKRHKANGYPPDALAFLDMAMAAGSNTQEMKIPRKDNSLGVFQIHSEFFYDSDQKLICIMGIFADITEGIQRQEKLETKAQMDSLTRVYNSGTSRRLISDRLAAKQPEDLDAFLILDIDHFKQVNDTLGHQIGDKALKILARSLKATVRSSDLVGRLGGDEFCVYMHHVPSYEFVAQLCHRINKAITEASCVNELGCTITVSIGGAMIHAQDDLDAVYARADKGLYDAKHKGRNTFSIFE